MTKFSYVKDPFQSKKFINEREKLGIKNLKNLIVFIDYSQTIDDVYENLDDCNPTKKRRVLIVFDHMIADIEFNKKLGSIVTEMSSRDLNIYFTCFYSTILFQIALTLRLNATHYFIIKIPNKTELQQIASNHLADIDFKSFMKLNKHCTRDPYSFLVNDTILSSDNPL